MTIHIQCERCQKKYTAPDQYAGKKFRCKQCGAVVEVLGLIPIDEVGPQASLAGPLQAMPVAPVRAVPVQGRPVQGIPILGIPVQGIPVQGVPIQGTPFALVDSPQAMPSAAAQGLIGGSSSGTGGLWDLLDESLAAGPALTAAGPLAAPSGFGPLAAPVRAKGSYRRSRTRVTVSKQLWFAGAGLGVLLVVVIACIVSPALAAILALGLLLLGALSLTVGAFWGLGLAFSEDALCGILYFFVPFYWMYYMVSRWPGSRGPVFAVLFAVVAMPIAFVVGITATGTGMPSRGASPPTRYSAPVYPTPPPYGR